MRFRATHKWGDIANLEGLLFFAQRADELLFDYTLDSYKPSALNSVSLCREAIRLIADIELGLIDKANLYPVMDELGWSISGDSVAKSLLDLPKDKYLLNPETEPLQRVRVKLEVLGRTLEPYRYLERCRDALSSAVKRSAKSEIDTLSRLLFTTLINQGLHKSHLYEKTIGFFYRSHNSEKIDAPDAIDEYLELIYPIQHEFEVLFFASSLLSDVKDSAEGAFRIEFHDQLPESLRDFANKNDLAPTGTEVIAQIGGFRALDCYTAREIAEGSLGRLRDLFTLYHHKTQISWRSETIITQCCIDAPRVVRLPKNPMEKGYDLKPERASQQLNRMLKSFRMTGRDFQKFNRAVDFHGMSVNGTDPENQLLNLWIALETIVPTHTGRAKIKQIVDGILPFISMNHIWRLVSRLTQDLLRWNRHETKRILRKVPDSVGASLRKKVFLLLVQPNAEEARKTLYENLRDFHLLRFRVFNLAQTLGTPKKALSVLETHERKVAWQLRRLYRTRNLIVHSGRTPSYIRTLVENGHDYLDQVLLTIIRMAGSEYKVRTIEQAFELSLVARKKLENSLKDSDAYDLRISGVVVNEHDFV